jgi:hypothetical protein
MSVVKNKKSELESALREEHLGSESAANKTFLLVRFYRVRVGVIPFRIYICIKNTKDSSYTNLGKQAA